jgi:hypothetical protein
MNLITAIHEAGHAVAHRRLFGDRHFSWGIALVDNQDQEEQGAAGWNMSDYLGHEDEQTTADLDVCLCAGYAAVVAAGFSEAEAAAGCDEEDNGDFRMVHGDLETAKAKALDLMREPENVKAVKRIADELLLRRRLHGDHVGLLLDLAFGEITEQFYLQLLSARGWNDNDPTLEPEA